MRVYTAIYANTYHACNSSYQPKHLIQAATKQTQAHTFHDRNSPSVQDIALKRSTLVINFCRRGQTAFPIAPDMNQMAGAVWW